MRKPMVYLSGPMTGRPQFNKAWFAKQEKILKRCGNTVLNPHKFFGENWLKKISKKWRTLAWYIAMARDLAILVIARAVNKRTWLFAAYDWRQSKGARAEVWLADKLGMSVVEED